MNDKLQQLYDLYKSNGLITIDFNTFASADPNQRKGLYDLGVQKGLFSTTAYETFDSAFSGVQPQQPVQQQQPAQEDISLFDKVKNTEEQLLSSAKKKENAILASQLDSSAQQSLVESTAKQQQEASSLASQQYETAAEKFPVLRNEFLKDVYQQLQKEQNLPDFVKEQLNQITPDLINLGEYGPKNMPNALALLSAASPLNISSGALSQTVAGLSVEEAVVPKMNYLFGPLGFKFEETGMTGDYMTVMAPNKETIEISLNNLTEGSNVKESKKLKDFIASNATKIPQIENYAAQYSGSNQKINSVKDVDSAVSKINSEYNAINAEALEFSKEYNDLEKEIADFNATPENLLLTPEYVEKRKNLEAKLLDINTKRQVIIDKNNSIEAQKYNLERTVGKYSEMKAQQGTWTGATYTWWGEGIASIAGGAANLFLDMTSIDYTGNATQKRQADIDKSVSDKVAIGNPEEDAKNGGYVVDAVIRLNKYNEGKGKVENIIPEPQKGQAYKDWYNSLSVEQRSQIRIKVEDDILKKSKKIVLPNVREGIKGKISDPNTTVEWRQLAEESFWGGAYAGTVKSLPALAMPGGWAGRTAAFFAQSTDAINQEMDNNPEFDEVPESEKLLITIPVGIANAALEELGFRNLISSKGFVNGLIVKAMRKAGVNTTERMLSSIIKNDIKSMAARGLLTITGASMAEGETGLLQQMSEYAVKDIYNLAKEKEMFDTPDTLKEYVYDVVRAGAQEAVGGFIMGTPYAASAAYRKQGFEGMSDEQFETFEAIANDDKIQSSFIASLKIKVASGELTMADAKVQLNDYRNSVGLYRSVPSNLSTKSKKEAMNLVREKRSLEDLIKGKEEALVSRERKRINEIDEKLNSLSDQSSTNQRESNIIPIGDIQIFTPEEEERRNKLQSEIDRAISIAPEGVPPLTVNINNELISFEDAQKELETLNQKANAVQEQTTSEVPIQSEAGVSEEVEGRKPTAEPQVTTEEITQKKDEIKSIDARISEIEKENQGKVYSAESFKEFNDLVSRKSQLENEISNPTPVAEVTTTEQVTTPTTGAVTETVTETAPIAEETNAEIDNDQELDRVFNIWNELDKTNDGTLRGAAKAKVTKAFNKLTQLSKAKGLQVQDVISYKRAKIEPTAAPAPVVAPTPAAAPTVTPTAEVAPAPVVEAAPVTEVTPTEEAPAPAPAPTRTKTAKEIKAEKELDDEMQSVSMEIDYSQNKIEQIKEEIEIEKGNTKEGIAEIKEKMAKVRETVTNKETRKNLLEELDAELEQFKEDQADIIQSYKDDIAQEKADAKKAQKRLDKLKAKREQATQPATAPKKPGVMTMAEIEKRFPLAAEFIKSRYNVSKVTAENSLDLLTRSYNELMKYKVGAEKLLLQIEEIENLVESLEQNIKKVSKEEFKKQIAESGDFTKAQLKIFNALIDSLQSETMPEYIRGEQANALGDNENFYSSALNRIVSREPKAFIHEIGHFGFFKILSKEDRLNFYRYMIDSTYGKGKPSLASRLALSSDKVVGVTPEGQENSVVSNVADNFAEYFAEQFRQWYMSERLFPKDIDTIFGKVAQFFNLFIEKLKSGKYVDQNLSEYFNKISANIEQQQKKNEKIQETLGVEQTMMDELQDLEDFLGIDPEISPMNTKYDTPLQKMALMYNMTESGFFPRNVSTSHVNRDFAQFNLEAKQSASGSYYLVNRDTKKMARPLRQPKGGIRPQASRMSVTTQPSTVKEILREELDNKDINSLRASLRRKAPNSYIIEVLDELQQLKKNENLVPSQSEVSDLLDNGVTLGNIINMLIEDGVFDTSQEAISYFTQIGGQESQGLFKRLSGLKTTISPEVSPMSVTPISVNNMSMEDVITTARDNGFSDDTIKALLMKRGYAANDIDSALTFNINFASAYTNNNPRTDSPLPKPFRTIDGGINDGIKLFFDVRNKLIEFAKTNKKYADIRAKAIELLEAHPIFQAQEDTKQKELIAAFDKTLNITRGVAVSARIAEIRKALKERIVGMKDLKNAQLILRNFIRQSLPAVKVPRVFFSLNGLISPAEGINYYNNLRKQVYDFARTDANGKLGKKLIKTTDEIKTFATDLIKNSELYKKQTPEVQDDMVSGLINAQYTGGKTHTLDIYSQKEVNKLIDIISQTDSKNFLAQAEKVFDIITEQRAKIKAGLIKEMMTLVNNKARTSKTATGKRRSKGLDAQGQSFYQNIKPILKAAITNDTNAMIAFAAELADTNAIDEALAKQAAGETLTTKEQALLDKVLAFDTFGDILSMELEEVQDLLDGLKGIRSESIVRLNDKRAERAAQREAMTEEADNQISNDYKSLYNPDGTPKDQNQLNQDKAAIWQSFKEGKVWISLKQWLDRYDFIVNPISDYFRKTLAHLGTISNILDKSGTFFTDNLYRPLNRMDEVNKTGYLNEMKYLDAMANSIKGVTKGYKQIRRMIESVGVVKMVIDGKNMIYNGDQLLRIYALSLNQVQRNKLNNMGFTEDKLNDIKKTLGPETIEFADKLVEYFSNEYFESINDIYALVNDVNLGYVENYFPTQTLAAKVDGKMLEDGDFSGIFNAESSPAFKERTDTSSPVDLSPSFTNVVESHLQAMERYKAYAVGVKKLNELFKIQSVNTLLEQTGLKPITKNLVNMSVNPNAGVRQTQTNLGKVMSKFSGYALAFKLAQIPKQATAIAAAYEDYQFIKGRKVPVLDTVMFAMDLARTLTFARANFNKFYNLSGNFRDRVNKGVEGDVYGLESGSKVFKPLSQKSTTLGDVKRFIKSAAAAPTMAGDIISVYGYMTNYNRDIANGMSPEAALEKFNNYNATLQSRRAADKSSIQFAQNEYVRAFTMFGSTGILQMNKVSIAFKNIMRSIANRKFPSGKDLRALSINLGVANAMFVAASYTFALMKGDEEDKDKVQKKMLDALIGLNLLYQLPIIGFGVETAVNAIRGERVIGDDVTNPYVSVFRKIKKNYDEENNVLQNFRPAAELALGMQLDPFIALYEGTTDEFNDEVLYDILGISPSYRPQNASSLENMSKSELKRYNPDEYERLYGPGSKGYDKDKAEKEQKAAERKARKDAMDDYYNYSSGDGAKRGGSRTGGRRGSRTGGSRIK